MRQILFLITLVVLFTGCAATEVTYEPIPVTADVSEEIAKLETDLEKSKTEQNNVFSPGFFRRAEEELADAKKDRNDGDDVEDILEHVAKGRAYLNRATEQAGVSRTKLPGLAEARQAALKASAPALATKEFDKAENQARELTKYLEDSDDIGSLSNKTEEIANLYRDAELAAIKQAKIGHAKNQIRTAQEEGAQEMAPRSLAIAQSKYDRAENMIAQDRYNVVSIDNAAQEANQSADLLLKITRETKTTDKKHPEELALEAYQKDLQFAEANKQLAGQKGKISSLQEKGAIDERFMKIRQNFSPDEAEVYKDGDQVVLRLKGIRFASNSSAIPTAAFPLLTKVHQAVYDFKAEQVVVQGHTDSRGRAELNKNLSQKRADAVASYLIANEAVDSSKIMAVGYGFDRPIASNKTPAGRAENRRIDVILATDPITENTSLSE